MHGRTSVRYRFTMPVTWQLHHLDSKFVNLGVINVRILRRRIVTGKDLGVVIFVVAGDFNGHVGNSVEDYHGPPKRVWF